PQGIASRAPCAQRTGTCAPIPRRTLLRRTAGQHAGRRGFGTCRRSAAAFISAASSAQAGRAAHRALPLPAYARAVRARRPRRLRIVVRDGSRSEAHSCRTAPGACARRGSRFGLRAEEAAGISSTTCAGVLYVLWADGELSH